MSKISSLLVLNKSSICSSGSSFQLRDFPSSFLLNFFLNLQIYFKIQKKFTISYGKIKVTKTISSSPTLKFHKQHFTTSLIQNRSNFNLKKILNVQFYKIVDLPFAKISHTWISTLFNVE